MARSDHAADSVARDCFGRHAMSGAGVELAPAFRVKRVRPLRARTFEPDHSDDPTSTVSWGQGAVGVPGNGNTAGAAVCFRLHSATANVCCGSVAPGHPCSCALRILN
jgi:hypothetical protein